MNALFSDTYYFLAVGNDRDHGHESAVRFAATYKGPMVTTEWVLTEVADALSLPTQRGRFLSLVGLLKSDEQWTIIEASHDLYERGVALFAERPDKSWSLTDCTSFVVMQELGITDALTADRHFDQAGFVSLLK